MLVIRLQRVGKKKQASFRIVLQEKSWKPKGKIKELLGFYDPRSKEKKFQEERINYWIGQGAQPSPTVHNLFVDAGVIEGEKIQAWKPKVKPEMPSTDEGPKPKKEETSKEEGSKQETSEQETSDKGDSNKEPEPQSENEEKEPEKKDESTAKEPDQAPEDQGPDPKDVLEKDQEAKKEESKEG